MWKGCWFFKFHCMSKDCLVVLLALNMYTCTCVWWIQKTLVKLRFCSAHSQWLYHNMISIIHYIHIIYYNIYKNNVSIPNVTYISLTYSDSLKTKTLLEMYIMLPITSDRSSFVNRITILLFFNYRSTSYNSNVGMTNTKTRAMSLWLQAEKDVSVK